MARKNNRSKAQGKSLENIINEINIKEVVTTEPENKEVVMTTPKKSNVAVQYEKNHSQIISEFIKYLKSITNLYEYATEQIEQEQKLTQDLLHQIEFCNDHKQRYKLSTQLHYCRQRRRYFKDIIEEITPIYNIINKDNTKVFMGYLSNALGEVRKSEKYHKDRTYYPRVLKSLGEIKNGEIK